MEFPLVVIVSFVVVKAIFVDSVVANGVVKFGVVKLLSGTAVEGIAKQIKIKHCFK